MFNPFYNENYQIRIIDALQMAAEILPLHRGKDPKVDNLLRVAQELKEFKEDQIKSWVPNTEYDKEDSWPPIGHPLYGLFHEARLKFEGNWQQERYENLLKYIEQLKGEKG